MTRIDLDDLERKARAATQGNWTTTEHPADTIEGWTAPMVAAVARGQRVYAETNGGVFPEADRQHIAANGPPVTLALVDRIRKLEAEVGTLRTALAETERTRDAALDACQRRIAELLRPAVAVAPLITAGQRAQLAAIAANAASDVSEYSTKRGVSWYDDRRVGRMLARDPLVADLVPLALAEIERLASAAPAVARVVDAARAFRQGLDHQRGTLPAGLGDMIAAVDALDQPTQAVPG